VIPVLALQVLGIAAAWALLVGLVFDDDWTFRGFASAKRVCRVSISMIAGRRSRQWSSSPTADRQLDPGNPLPPLPGSSRSHAFFALPLALSVAPDSDAFFGGFSVGVTTGFILLGLYFGLRFIRRVADSAGS
jgi:hypothetical protein